ncbi:carbonic anhydrase family protein [Citrobacter koseri]|uniref:carbonic anhydrase family protein n=1 Tax=Citrobacter koseri TaxID=545 RepID=UPI000E154062|nr:carbonic anhydrase family protein [Citrobacter koseri]MBJ8672806.1 carbonic anhydrase family protein [Citrobacter koseri]MBJ9229577.1 carbonic anhydrase family protein [Citrobacter koseri]MBJ9302070.1 carbonic anhydrase family protein [Citrobacter koseri]MBJ9366576.1 carbonic anhydrase family protein [Citrobacter koseri]SUX94671.1 Carbonic anhydrase precursor [Citrobacter koseri]
MKLISLTTAFLAICMMPVSVSATDWSYEGDTSPAHWGEINKAYKLCQTGMSQSPVDILTTNEIQLPPLNEWKGLPLIMRLINSCAIMGYTSSRRNSL